jgi:8-oxo-dGTP pyrophosphatase MutT (NUDIX family)
MRKQASEESFGIIPLRRENGVWKVLLILHQGGHHWAFPKGHGNEGETPLESAKRELKEETGLEVEHLLQETPLVEKYQFHRHRETVTKTVHYFPAVVKGYLMLQQEEIRDAKWVDLKDANQHLTFKEARAMCNNLIKLLNV